MTQLIIGYNAKSQRVKK